jgi:hypothetical protein
MPIRKYAAGASFGPDAIASMDTAFQKACTALNIRGSDPLVETIAKKVVSLASQGVTDPDEIWRCVVADTDLGPR